MDEKKSEGEELYFESVVKKTKTGITFPKELKDELFHDKEEIFFRLIVPATKDKIILEIISKEKADEISDKITMREESSPQTEKKEKKRKIQKEKKFEPRWGQYFVYDFENKDRVKPILESAFEKFSEKPMKFDDAMGRVKYVLISYLSSTKTENAKLYYSVIRFLIDIIDNFNKPELIDWIYDKLIPNIESKFLYELSLLDLLELSIKSNKIERAKTFVEAILKDINSYPPSELYNIMNNFNQLVKKIEKFDTPQIFALIKDELIKYEANIKSIDYKIQIIELLEKLGLIEDAYTLAENLSKKIPPESINSATLREIIKRLSQKPI
jgi:hypothetical protein